LFKLFPLLPRLTSLHDAVCRDDSLPDEFLFGRVGYLFALLFVRQHLGEEVVNNSILSKVSQVSVFGFFSHLAE
jgi:hypothetical protein